MKKTLVVIKVVVALTLITFILFQIGLVEIGRALLTIDPVFMGLGYIVLISILILNSINLKILFSPLEHIPLKKMIPIVSFSWSLGFLTPGKIGEFSLAYFLHDIPSGKVLAVMVLEKLVTITILLFFSFVGFLILPQTPIILAPLLIILAGVLALLFFGKNIVKRFILRSYASLFRGFSTTLFLYAKTKKRLILSNMIFAGTRWILFSLMTFLLFLGLGLNVSFFIIIPIIALSSLISMIPISINGLGIREGSLIILFSQVGISVTVSAAVALLSLVIAYTTVFVVFVIAVRKITFSRTEINAFLHPKAADSL